MLKGMREQLANPPDVSIATAYINPGGFSLLAAELERLPVCGFSWVRNPTPPLTARSNCPQPTATTNLTTPLRITCIGSPWNVISLASAARTWK